MSHSHHNHQHRGSAEDISSGRLFITMMLNFVITIAEVIGGLMSGSLALISDALHNFSDGIAIIISYIAIKLKSKPKSEQYTFGLKRAEILAAVINASTLIIISFFLIKEALERFFEPQSIAGELMLVTALIGLTANVIGTLLLKKASKDNLNIKAAYLHLLSDAVSSIAVILGGLAIIFWDVYWIDPVLTILISVYILRESYFIVKEAINVIMMGSPQDISLHDIRHEIEQIEGVNNVHHTHLWQLNEHNVHYEAHVEIEDMAVSETTVILDNIDKLLKNKFRVNHITVQFECGECGKKKLL